MAACAGKKLDILIAYSGNASNGMARFGKKQPVRRIAVAPTLFAMDRCHSNRILARLVAGGGWLIADHCGLTAPARHLL
jgi:hypothetical protein